MDKKLVIFGTRPEFIKLYPLVEEVNLRGIRKDYLFLFTGQHQELMLDLFDLLDFTPDLQLPVKKHENSLSYSFAYLLHSLQEKVDQLKKEFTLTLILAQGDTTTSACASLCAFFNQIPFAHIEAGLRTGNLNSPFPEEYFRKLISLSTTLHFAPTPIAKSNLIAESVPEKNIVITGNTGVDALRILGSKLDTSEALKNQNTDSKNTILITCHHRENQNKHYEDLMQSVIQLTREYPHFNFIWLSHKSPFIENTLKEFAVNKLSNLSIKPAMSIVEMIAVYKRSLLILTDSGGIQEEAVSFNIPVLVLRSCTERIESVDLGYSLLCENLQEDLIEKFKILIDRNRQDMHNPYGDGFAAKRIVDYLLQHGLN